MSDVNPCISEDIWFKIFTELPVKTLGKCRCVCKSWHSLIISSSFMAAHLKHYTQNNANSLILYKKKSENPCYEQCVLFRDSAQLMDGNSTVHSSTFPVAVCEWPYFQLLGSVNGLLCISDDAYIRTSSRILIWNPILEKCIKLPMAMASLRDRISVLGFGYDCRKSDHRVVRIYYSKKETPVVEVFSVQERTRRIICADYLVQNSITHLTFANCFVNGVIHWFTWDAENRPLRAKTLLRFNVTEEKFDMMELPETIINMGESKNDSDFGVFEYQGMLSVSLYNAVHRQGTDISDRCQIWVQREYNNASSWFKILDVRPLPGISHTGPVQYLGKNGELLGFTKKHSDELVYYDPRTGHIKELGHRSSFSTRFSAYSESLVFLDQQISDYIDDSAEREWYIQAISVILSIP
ncbi:F-box/kelch-repeat protein At3g23880-like [Silene latifolia]|uniref:F-box/kelch-repeat protein At3g23880-like n=1 Tax=Silene latifolia TaxID=37657 RepID=UPI003D76DCFC